MNLETYINELTNEEINEILNSEYGYTFFDVSVFNTGSVIRLEFSDDFEDHWVDKCNEENWNGYDLIIETDEVIYQIENRRVA